MNAPPKSRPRPLVFPKAQWIFAVAISLAAIHLHFVAMRNLGGLWRDEAGGVSVATRPALAELWHALPHDSFPALFPLALRAWTALVGEDDAALRWLGFGVGLLLLASLWFAGRIMGAGVPVVSLGLLAFNVTVIRWGDSLRAYGLGSALVVTALALVWHFTRRPTLATGLLAAVVALLSVQTLYQNAFLILAACVAGCAPALRRKRPRQAVWTTAIGIPAAVSLLPYIAPLRQAQDWWILEKAGLHPGLALGNVSQALGPPLVLSHPVWLLLFGLAFVHVWIQFGSRATRPAAGWNVPNVSSRAGTESDNLDLAVFGALAIMVGGAGFILFLKLASLPTQAWYYIPIIVFVGVCLDAICRRMRRGMRTAATVVAIACGAAAYPFTLLGANWRITNMDHTAAHLAQESKPGDLIVVHPWYCGISFQRYYQGAAPWTTLPPLEDHQIHRYDLLKAQMQNPNPIRPVLDQIRLVLQAGHRVWLVGALPLPESPPPEARPAPHNPWGWFDEPYSRLWGAQAGYFLKTHAERGTFVIAPARKGVNIFENLPLIVVTGWKTNAAGRSFGP